MKQISVHNISVPDRQCNKCRFYKEKKKMRTITHWDGRSWTECWGIDMICVLFNVKLDGAKKCNDCRTAEMDE